MVNPQSSQNPIVQRGVLMLCMNPTNPHSAVCGVVLVSTQPQQLSQARHYDIYNIETNNQQMWPTSTIRPTEGQKAEDVVLFCQFCMMS